LRLHITGRLASRRPKRPRVADNTVVGDPLSLIINADLAELLVLAHSYDESIQQSRKTIEMDPNFALAHNQLAQAYLQKHIYDEAVAEVQKAVQQDLECILCRSGRAVAQEGIRAS